MTCSKCGLVLGELDVCWCDQCSELLCDDCSINDADGNEFCSTACKHSYVEGNEDDDH
jgi:hypothetical protein